MLPEAFTFWKSNAVFGCKCPGSFFCRQPGNPSEENPWLTLTWIWQATPISLESNTHYLHWVSRYPPLLGLYCVMFLTLCLDQRNQLVIGDPVFQRFWWHPTFHWICAWRMQIMSLNDCWRVCREVVSCLSMLNWIWRNGQQEMMVLILEKIHCCG